MGKELDVKEQTQEAPAVMEDTVVIEPVQTEGETKVDEILNKLEEKYPEPDVPVKKKMSRRKKIALISSICVVVVLLGSILGYLLWPRQSGDPQGPTTNMLSALLTGDAIAEDTNIILAGVDKGGYRTDTLMVANYDTNTKKVNILQIPRDTRVDGNGRADKKINSAYFSGFETLRYELNLATGIKADKYVVIDTEGFRKAIDALGGVEVDVPFDMNYDDPTQDLHIHLKEGRQVLNGEQAEQFARYRKDNDGTGYAEGDVGRMNAQKEFLYSIIDKALSMKGVLKIPELIQILEENVETNMTDAEIMSYATTLMKLDSSQDVVFHDIPGEMDYRYGGWYFFVDEEEMETLASQYFFGDKNPGVTPIGSTSRPQSTARTASGTIRNTPRPTYEAEEYVPEETPSPKRTEEPESRPDVVETPSTSESPDATVTPEEEAPTPTGSSRPQTSPESSSQPSATPQITAAPQPSATPEATPMPEQPTPQPETEEVSADGVAEVEEE